MKYAMERKIINHGVAYSSLNAGQSTISSQTRKQDAVFRPSDDGTSNGTNGSINGGLVQNLQYYRRGQEAGLLLRNIRC
jgi:hypothetical protein